MCTFETGHLIFRIKFEFETLFYYFEYERLWFMAESLVETVSVGELWEGVSKILIKKYYFEYEITSMVEQRTCIMSIGNVISL